MFIFSLKNVSLLLSKVILTTHALNLISSWTNYFNLYESSQHTLVVEWDPPLNMHSSL